ncbi:MAG: ROK family protein [Oliverpabstia sp.]
MSKVENMTSKDVFDQAEKGDLVARELIEFVGDILGMTLSHIACVCDPEVFVIGGGVSKAGSILTDAISRYYRKYSFRAVNNTEIVLVQLGNDAGIYGGVKLVIA